MPARNQARIRIRRRMLDRDVRVTDLAEKLGHDVSVISKAINHGRFPRVLKKVKEALDV